MLQLENTSIVYIWRFEIKIYFKFKYILEKNLFYYQYIIHPDKYE